MLGLIVGLIYVFQVPPWMHYDEPGHFEYAWLIANQDTWPAPGDYDQYMRREVASSMLEHRFQDYTGVTANITPVYEPVQLLISQVGDQPLYYFLASLPLRILKYTDIDFQLYVSRLVSLSFFLLTIFASHQATKLIFGKKHPMAWMAPAFLIAIPSFVDLMTAVNNDSLAVTAFSMFVWAATLLLLRGFTLKRLGFLVLTVALCYGAKSTAWLVIPGSVLVLLFSVLRGPKQKFAWIAVAVALVVGASLSVVWDKAVPAFFATSGKQSNILRVSNVKAISGEYVLRQSGQDFNQMITSKSQQQLQGRSVTLSAWVWADKATEIKFPGIGRLNMEPIVLSDQTIQVTTEPTMFFAEIELPAGTYVSWVTFYGSKDATIYWDDISLIGKNTNTASASGGEEYYESMRNGTIEQGWPLLRDFVDQVISRANISSGASHLIQALDFDGISWYLRIVSITIFRSFWGSFGWGAVPLLGTYGYQVLVIFSAFCSLSALLFLATRLSSVEKPLLFIFLLMVLLQLAFVIARGLGTWYTRRYFPVARYFYPVILPLSIFLVYGFYRLLRLAKKNTRTETTQVTSNQLFPNLVFVLTVLFLVSWGIISILSYYT